MQEPDPEKLLRELDAEIRARRARRGSGRGGPSANRIVALLVVAALVLVGLMAALNFSAVLVRRAMPGGGGGGVPGQAAPRETGR